MPDVAATCKISATTCIVSATTSSWKYGITYSQLTVLDNKKSLHSLYGTSMQANYKKERAVLQGFCKFGPNAYNKTLPIFHFKTFEFCWSSESFEQDNNFCLS